MQKSTQCIALLSIIGPVGPYILWLDPGQSAIYTCYRTVLPNSILCTTVAWPSPRPANLTGHLAIWCYRLNDELLEYVHCGCVQSYITAQIGCLYRKAEKTCRAWARKTLGRDGKPATNTLNFSFRALRTASAHEQLGRSTTLDMQYVDTEMTNIQTTVHESKSTVSYTVILAYNPIKAF